MRVVEGKGGKGRGRGGDPTPSCPPIHISGYAPDNTISFKILGDYGHQVLDVILLKYVCVHFFKYIVFTCHFHMLIRLLCVYRVFLTEERSWSIT